MTMHLLLLLVPDAYTSCGDRKRLWSLPATDALQLAGCSALIEGRYERIVVVKSQGRLNAKLVRQYRDVLIW